MYSDDDLRNMFDCYYKTEEEYQIILDAYNVFKIPYHESYDAFKQSKDDDVKLSRKYKNARNTIQELLQLTATESLEKEVIKRIDDAIDWLTTSRRDIKKPYQAYAEQKLLSTFKKTKTKEILTHFNSLLKD